ncbi:MAG: LysM peptidoglycan-binding domain-containing protein [Gaiellaceae bacterium]
MFGLRAGSLLTLVAVAAAAAALLLGAASPGESAGPTEHYVVRGGDTLWSIAEARYSGDPRRAIWQIRRDNGLGTRSIVVGDVLDLPTR